MRHVTLALSALLLLLTLAGQTTAPPHAASYARYAVAADHPLASQAGAEILEAGGNAADAAAASMLALGVVSPASSGLGGGGFGLYYRASDRSVTFLDFREMAPGATTETMFARRPGDDDATAAARSQTGGLAVAVPGEPAGLDALLTRFGSRRVPRPRIAAPAARLAERGWPASRYVSQYASTFAAVLAGDPLLAGWLDGPGIPQGRTLRNPALARTLRTFGRSGARAFYRGAIAREIVRAVRARGGLLTAADLAAYTVRERAPLEGTFFGRRWVMAPPPSAGGVTMFESLALLERWQPDGGWQEGPAFRHALAESWKGGFVDRATYLGDPDHASIPVEALLEGGRLDRRAARFDPEHARPASEWQMPLSDEAHPTTQPPSEHGTSHVCVVDGEGNIAAFTTTVNLPFGARLSAAGMLLNDEMDDFGREVGVPNAFGLPGGEANLPRPGRRPVSTMSPTLVFEGGLPAFCAGGSGGSRIVTATEQVLLFAMLLHDPMGDAVARRRVHHQGVPATLSVERGLDPTLRAALEARGHATAEVEVSANVQAIHLERDAEGRVRALHAASDLRKDGEPRGR